MLLVAIPKIVDMFETATAIYPNPKNSLLFYPA